MQHNRIKSKGTKQNPHVNGAWIYKMICEAETQEGLRPFEAVPRTHSEARSGVTPAPAEGERKGKPSSEEKKRLWQERRDTALAIFNPTKYLDYDLPPELLEEYDSEE